MALIIRGEAIKENFTLIKKSAAKALTEEDIFTPQSAAGECCVDGMIALAEASFTNVFYNDSYSPEFDWDNNFTTAVMYLQKYVSGAWTTVATLNDTTYGTYYSYGFYDTIYQESKIGYAIEWALVLTVKGEGNYRVKCTGTKVVGGTIDKYSLEFKLLTYTADRAEGSVLVEWWLNGNIGDPENDFVKRDFGTLNWYNKIRFNDSKFGFDESEETRENVKYQNGKQVWLKDSSKEIYTLKTARLDNQIRRYIKFNLMKGDEIRVTDFNSNNSVTHIRRYVIPRDIKFNYVEGSKIASCEIKFENAYQNNDHKRQ